MEFPSTFQHKLELACASVMRQLNLHIECAFLDARYAMADHDLQHAVSNGFSKDYVDSAEDTRDLLAADAYENGQHLAFFTEHHRERHLCWSKAYFVDDRDGGQTRYIAVDYVPFDFMYEVTDSSGGSCDIASAVQFRQYDAALRHAIDLHHDYKEVQSLETAYC